MNLVLEKNVLMPFDVLMPFEINNFLENIILKPIYYIWLQ